MLNIGLLRKRLTIQRRSTSQDEMGEQVDLWQNIGQAWGMISGLSSNEQTSAQSVHAVDTHEIVLRYFAGLRESDRVLYTDAEGVIHYWDLTGILDDDERHRVMTCTAVEGLKPG